MRFLKIELKHVQTFLVSFGIFFHTSSFRNTSQSSQKCLQYAYFFTNTPQTDDGSLGLLKTYTALITLRRHRIAKIASEDQRIRRCLGILANPQMLKTLGKNIEKHTPRDKKNIVRTPSHGRFSSNDFQVSGENHCMSIRKWALIS